MARSGNGFVFGSGDGALRDAFPKEVRQLKVHFVRMRPGDAVRAILHYHVASALDQLRATCSRSADRQNAVRVAMNDQRRHIDALDILAKVLMPRWHASERRRRRGASRNVPARLDSLFTDALTKQQISVVKILEKLSEKRVPDPRDDFLDSREDTAVHAIRIVRRLQ